MDYSLLTVIVPTLNEEKSIGLLANSLLKSYDGISVIVSDDGSRDQTRNIVQSIRSKKVLFLDRSKEIEKGLTASVLDAIERCRTPYFIVMDGDLQHPIQAVEPLFRELSDGSELAIAVREKVSVEWPFSRKVISYGANFLGQVRLIPRNYFFCDVMSGFFGMDTSVAKRVLEKNRHRFVLGGYKVLFDFLKLLPKQRVATVPFVFGSREFGESKINSSHMALFLKSLVS